MSFIATTNNKNDIYKQIHTAFIFFHSSINTFACMMSLLSLKMKNKNDEKILFMIVGEKLGKIISSSFNRNIKLYRLKDASYRIKKYSFTVVGGLFEMQRHNKENNIKLEQAKQYVDQSSIKFISNHYKIIEAINNGCKIMPHINKEYNPITLMNKLLDSLLKGIDDIKLTSRFQIGYLLFQLKNIIELLSLLPITDHLSYLSFINRFWDLLNGLQAVSGYNFTDMFTSEISSVFIYDNGLPFNIPKDLVNLILSYDVIHDEKLILDRIQFININNDFY